jgi:hypothetical protein
MSVGDYTFPIWADVIGNVANGITVLSMIIYAIYKIYQTRKQKEKFWSAFAPAPTWIPRRLKDRVFVNMIHVKEKYTKYDDADNYVWPTNDEQIAESKIKEKDKAKVSLIYFYISL